MFTIEMLPAQRGDSLWITYGTKEAPHHVLIDAGPQNTLDTLVPELERRITAIPGRKNRVELLVVTHIDADHIQGDRLAAVGSPAGPAVPRRLVQRVPPPPGTARRARRRTSQRRAGSASGALECRVRRSTPSWSPTTDRCRWSIFREGCGSRCSRPIATAMLELVPEWEETCRKAGIAPGGGAPIVQKSFLRDELLGGFDPDLLASSRFSSDPSKANGAGIAFIAEFEGKRALLLADSPVKLCCDSLDRLGPRPHRFDAVKISHHGSRRNTSREFAEAVQAKKWLVSTDGAVFGHPDPGVSRAHRRRPEAHAGVLVQLRHRAHRRHRRRRR